MRIFYGKIEMKRKKYLINWEMVSLTKEKWVCIINIVARIIAPLKKWLSRKKFSIEHNSL